MKLHPKMFLRFHLSFENSVCQDYVTEKLFKAAERPGVIPVVMGKPFLFNHQHIIISRTCISAGGAKYSSLAPRHSLINVNDFMSPKALAAYLKGLESDRDALAKYFWWKQHYSIERDQV